MKKIQPAQKVVSVEEVSDMAKALADRVVLGYVVEADLADGTFVALMNELKARGYVLQPRAESDPVKWLKPFLFRVERKA
jgi:hypothetical protein